MNATYLINALTSCNIHIAKVYSGRLPQDTAKYWHCLFFSMFILLPFFLILDFPGLLCRKRPGKILLLFLAVYLFSLYIIVSFLYDNYEPGNITSILRYIFILLFPLAGLLITGLRQILYGRKRNLTQKNHNKTLQQTATNE